MSRVGQPAVARLVVVLSVALALGIALVLVISAGLVPALDAAALAAEPTPVELLEPGDPRSEGEGPGLVGSPLGILAGVVALGIVTAAVTLLLVRLSARR